MPPPELSLIDAHLRLQDAIRRTELQLGKVERLAKTLMVRIVEDALVKGQVQDLAKLLKRE